jgi:hypothetical protein
VEEGDMPGRGQAQKGGLSVKAEQGEDFLLFFPSFFRAFLVFFFSLFSFSLSLFYLVVAEYKAIF